MTRLVSHIDEQGEKLLQTHLQNVASLAVEIGPDTRETATGTPLSLLLETTGRCHDLAKASPAYQRYLRKQGQRDLVGHAPLGALATYYALRGRNIPRSDALLALLAVWAHHRDLPDAVPRLSKIADDSGWDGLQKQATSITDHASDFAAEIMVEASGGAVTWRGFTETLKDGLATEIQQALRDPTTQVEREGCDIFAERAYGDLLVLSGSLTMADKFDAARINEEPNSEEALHGKRASAANISAKIEQFPTRTGRRRKLDERRSAIRQRVLNAVREGVADSPGAYSLTLPTGFGKTYTGLSAALEIGGRTGHKRVVYSLPFRAIIDQTEADLTNMYQTDPSGHLLTVHHSLAETRSRLDGEQDQDSPREVLPDKELTDENFREELLVAEAWRAGITLTTFVQLFESLTGPTNRQGLKLPALAESVIIIDEPQSLPMEWRGLVEELLGILVDRYGCRLILMTATKPHIVSQNRVTELYQAPEDDYRWADRVRYTFDQSCRYEADPLSYETAAERIIEASDRKNVLAVCNTKDSAEHLHAAVSERNAGAVINQEYLKTVRDGEWDETARAQLLSKLDGSETPTLVLTTRLRPHDRKALLGVLQDLLERGVRVVCVSTQLIEAGVDVSFGAVYRDFGPLDSIVQVAGRCNRHFEREHGSVMVWKLDVPPAGGVLPAKAIYTLDPPNLLSITRDALYTTLGEQWTGSEIGDSRISWDAANEYQKYVARRIGEGVGLGAVANINCEALRDLRLIPSRETYVDLVIPITEENEALIERVTDQSLSFRARRQATRQVRDLTVNVKRPEWAVYPTATTLFDDSDDTLVLRADCSDRYYGFTGLIPTDN